MPLPLNQSIRQIGRNHWQIGTFQCERIETTPPTDVLTAWKDHGCTYTLQETIEDRIGHPPWMEPSAELRLVHEGGSLSAVWAIGTQAFCKVKAWNSAMEPEDRTIAFVRKIAPQIPIPEVIYTWTDQDRSFLILRRIEGSTLRDAWTILSPSQRNAIVKTITAYCDILAQNTSQVLQSATGKAILEPYLAPSGCDLLGSFTYGECMKYFSTPATETPALGQAFHFYHPDLGPGNIIVSDGRVAGIIDWEAAGYYPHFWIATKPSVSPGLDFYPSIVEIDDFEWRKCLRTELEKWGYPQASGWYLEWRNLLDEELEYEGH